MNRVPGLAPLLLSAACASAPRPAAAPPAPAQAAASTPAAPSAAGDPALAVTQLADEVLAAWIKTFPEEALLSGLEGAPDDGLGDNSLAARKARQSREDAWIARLDQIDGEALWGRPEWITHGYLRFILDSSRGERICRFELWAHLTPLSGWQSMLVHLAEAQPIGTSALREKALSRWRLIPRLIDNDVASAREGLRLGYTSPRENVDLFIKQLDDLLQLPPGKSPFFGPATRDPALKEDWTALLRDQIYPAIQRERDFLRDEYRKGARQALGVAANPDGVACYRATFKSQTTIDRPPDETFALGETTVARNLAEATALARKAFGVGELPAIVARLNKDPENHFRTRDEQLAFARAAVARAKEGVAAAFATLPRAEMAVEPVPPFMEKTASDSYNVAANDGTRPATYRINLGRFRQRLRSNSEVTSFHEGYPGHHVQATLARESGQHHPIEALVGNSAFIEGWARYAEGLAEELGLYSSDHARVHRRLWPARGMVVDPGLHLRGWTRQQTVAYMKAVGFPDEECDAAVSRIASWPAQVTSYDTGGLEIMALRRKAEAALGERFDLKKFHGALLQNGSVTLPMLRRIIDRWIESQ